MDRSKGAVLKIALITFCLLFIFCAIIFYRQLKDVKLEFSKKESQFLKEKQDLSNQIRSLNELVNQKTEAIASFEKEKQAISGELTTLQEKNKELDISYNNLKSNYADLTAKKDYIVRKFNKLKERSVSLGKKATVLEKGVTAEKIKEILSKEEDEKIKNVLEDALQNINLIKSGKFVELQPIVVDKKEDNEEAPANADDKEIFALPTKIGKVVMVDRTVNIIIADVGQKDGIEESDPCTIVKGEQEFAYGKVTSVRSNISAIYITGIKKDKQVSEIKQGDKVIITKAQ